MEPQQTTPPDGSERGASRGQRRRRAQAEDGLFAETRGEPGSEKDRRARYGAPPPPPPRASPDFSALFILLDGLRRAAPGDLQERLTSLIREGLLTLRSLIDWYLERLDRGPREPEVEHIPID